MTESPRPRTYRFAPLDRGGWILGLGGAQCTGLGAGVVVAGSALRSGLPAPAVLAPLAAAALFAFGSWEGRSAHEWTPVVLRHLVLRAAGRHRFLAPVPVARLGDERVPAPTLPPFLAGLEVLDGGPTDWCPGGARRRGGPGSPGEERVGHRGGSGRAVLAPGAGRAGAGGGALGRRAGRLRH